jgi:hypothetical protein
MEQAMENVKKISRTRLSSVVSFALMAGLIPHDQENKPLDEIEIRGDFASLMQFVELMYEIKEEDEYFQELLKKGLDDL